jgi:long-subunit fatty acid transport protein
MSFPVTRWSAATMGIMPYADKGYEIFVEEDIPGVGRTGYSYFGNGTVSKAYFGAGFNLTKSLSVGANVYYLFGTLNQNNSIYFLDDPQQYGISEVEQTRLRDFSYLLGMQYDLKLKEDQFLTVGATFQKKSEFTAFHFFNQQKVLQYGGGTLTDSILTIQDEPGKIQLPASYGIGISFTKLNKLEINADFYYSEWGRAEFYGRTVPELNDQTRISFGAEYTPEEASIRSYLKRIRYRAGIHYDKSYLKINNQQLNETGISFGMGMPVSRSRSIINMAVELGRRGSVSDNLIRENYTKISLYLTLSDRWFIQRKFD